MNRPMGAQNKEINVICWLREPLLTHYVIYLVFSEYRLCLALCWAVLVKERGPSQPNLCPQGAQSSRDRLILQELAWIAHWMPDLAWGSEMASG